MERVLWGLEVLEPAPHIEGQLGQACCSQSLAVGAGKLTSVGSAPRSQALGSRAA